MDRTVCAHHNRPSACQKCLDEIPAFLRRAPQPVDDELTAANARIAELEREAISDASTQGILETDLEEANRRIAELEAILGEALEALERHIPEGHGLHPNPEYEIVEKVRDCFKSRA